MDDGAITRIVVLTGAGISAESGIATFRASDGLWENHRVEDVATPEGFRRDPQLVHRFYNERRAQHEGRSKSGPIHPNAGHLALAAFEKEFLSRSPDHSFLLVTQNVDALHERAGSSNVIHMHGELLKMRCLACAGVLEWLEDCGPDVACPSCTNVGGLRPHIVWFGEMPFEMERIMDSLSACDLFVSIGTSGNVYPAAGFFRQAQQVGAHTVELNLEPSVNAMQFDDGIYGRASDIVPSFFQQLLS